MEMTKLKNKQTNKQRVTMMTNVSSCFPLPVAKINNGILNGSHIDPFEQFYSRMQIFWKITAIWAGIEIQGKH